MGGYPVAPPLGMCTGLASDSDTVEEGAGTLYKRDTVLSVLPYEIHVRMPLAPYNMHSLPLDPIVHPSQNQKHHTSTLITEANGMFPENIPAAVKATTPSACQGLNLA